MKLLYLLKIKEALKAHKQKIIELSIETLKELNMKKAEERAEAARLETSLINLLKASTFLNNFINNSKALNSLSKSFQIFIGFIKGVVDLPGFLIGIIELNSNSLNSIYIPTYFLYLYNLSISLNILINPLILF